MLTVLADEVAPTLDNALSHEPLREAQDRLAFLVELANSLVAQLPLGDVLRAVMRSARRVARFDSALVALPDAQSQRLRASALDGSDGRGVRQEHELMEQEDTVAAHVFRTGIPWVGRLVDVPGGGLDLEPQWLERGFAVGCVLPVISGDRILGTLSLRRHEDTVYTDDEVSFLRHVAHQIAMALDNAHAPGRPGGSREALETAYAEIERLKDQLQRENIALREEIDTTSMFEEIVGASAPLRTVLSHVAKVAPTDSTVLITGETGTGKELVARAIHKRSPRSGHAFVSVNCAAIPSSLVASELFGHEKGAFTGAVQRRKGRFELADGGTIFLDEVGELPAETQMTLLRVLQERQFERVGGSEAIRTDVRVIAATNRDLEVAIADGAFRADLFYRLNVFPLEVPALRERRADIPLLVEYFIHRYAQRAGKRIRGVSRASLSLLQAYEWPGNIRELQNVVERAVILSDSDVLSIDERWLSGRSFIPRAVASVPPTLATHEKDAIEKALTETKGRVAGPFGAAGRLGVPPSTLESKIKALQIDKRRFKSA
jgi:transcriptional regulator with GAF, ATPase, and Fis domain